MKKVKLTLLKTTPDQALAREYGAEGLGPVIFRLEATGEETAIDYTPAR